MHDEPIIIHDKALEVLFFYVLEGLRVVAQEILPKQTIIITFSFQLLYSPTSVKRYTFESALRSQSTALLLQVRITTYYLTYVLLIVVPMVEFTTLLSMSIYLLIRWEILTGKFIDKYMKAVFIARNYISLSSMLSIVC